MPKTNFNQKAIHKNTPINVSKKKAFPLKPNNNRKFEVAENNRNI